MAALVAIVPLFNHANTILGVLGGICAEGLVPVVVDDGSTDGGGDRAAQWLQAHCPAGRVIRLPRNLGKAAALRAGFDAAAASGATHALTIDADGQHDTRAVQAFIAAVQANAWGQVLVLGDRRPIPATYPLARLAGRMLSGLAIRAACGAVVSDAACGMRLYPLATTRALRCLGGRYAWEEEAVTRCVWRGARVVEVAIPVIYRTDTAAPSHYRFGRDWSEGTVVLVASVVLRVFALNTLWNTHDAPRSDLAWPLARRTGVRGFMCSAMAAVALGVTALMAASTAGAPLAAGVLGVLAALAVWRTRCPLLPAVAGWVIGATVPLAAPIVACIAVPAWYVWLVRRLRARHPHTVTV